MNLFYLLLAITIAVLFIHSIKKNVVHGENNIKAYGQKTDSIITLFNRIEWANNYNGRINIFTKYLFYSSITVLLTSVVILNSIPSPKIYLQTLFVCWFSLISLDGYFNHHCDKYHNYAISRNLKILKKKLKIRHRYTVPEDSEKRFSTHSEAMNYVYGK